MSSPNNPNFNHDYLDRNLGMELVRVTEAAALTAGLWAGRGDKEGVDGAAVRSMRDAINTVNMRGVVVIGEGEKDHAPMLANGEKVGNGWGPEVDVAVDPVDGTRLCAEGRPNAISVMAVSDRGAMYDPSKFFYMKKIATGPEAAHVIDIDASVEDNIKAVAKAKEKSVRDITVVILDRPRHADLQAAIREAGAKVRLISDGDVAGAVAAARHGNSVDLMMGIGGTPEGIITAVAMRCMGGAIQGRLWPDSPVERQRAESGLYDTDRVLMTEDLCKSDNCFFCATGVTNGDLTGGVSFRSRGAYTRSLLMRGKSGTIRFIEGFHRAEKLQALFTEYGKRGMPQIGSL